MVRVGARADSSKILIVGQGISISEPFDLSDSVTLRPSPPALDLDKTVKGCHSFRDYAAAIEGDRRATFALEVNHAEGGEALAVAGWNALWIFTLLAIACRTPCRSLYSISDGAEPQYGSATRNPFGRELQTVAASHSQLEWAKSHLATFQIMIKTPEFASASRCLNVADELVDYDVRIMLIWSGIEGLLSVDGELNRRLAMYTAMIFPGSAEEKEAYAKRVRDAYAIRSRAVHGRGDRQKFATGYEKAHRILCDLLGRCIEIGRVPMPDEMDRLAYQATPA